MKMSSDVEATWSRHPEFWFVDGSITLLADNLPCPQAQVVPRGVAFRVHKTFLARHSVVFRDMFSLPQPEGKLNTCDDGLPAESVEQGLIDDCPVVRIHDTPDDVASLLYALYDGPKFGDNGKDDFRIVSGVLRLASKYVIESLRTKALAHLSVAWPSTLKGWDAREELLANSTYVSEENRYYPNPVEVINLAREVNAPCLLPSAFYDLSRYSLSEIFDELDLPSDPEHKGHSRLELPLSDTKKLALGKEAAHCAVSALIRSLAMEARSNPAHTQTGHVIAHSHAQAGPSRGIAARHGQGSGRGHRRSDSGALMGRCGAPAACWRDVCELVDLATQHYLFDRERGASDPLYVAEELAMLKGSGSESAVGLSSTTTFGNGGPAGINIGLLEEDFNDTGTCRSCARAFESWAKKERERLWRSIPGWFKLDV